MYISVLLADDHKIFREGIKSLLAQESGFSVVAEADDGAGAVEMARASKPDVAILDISMPRMNGFEAARAITAQTSQTRVVILSMHLEKGYVQEALKAGATGFLAKTCTSAELVEAIRQVVDGQPYISPTISSAVLGLISDPEALPLPAAPKSDANLSRRENEVLRLMAEGNNTKGIALLLGISTKTVETYRHNLMKKLGLTNMADLVRHAIRNGMVELG